MYIYVKKKDLTAKKTNTKFNIKAFYLNVYAIKK